MQRFDDRPITEESEVAAFLDRAPFAVDRGEFTRFVLGFPHQYLKQTAPAEVLKHFALVQSLGRRVIVSTLSRETDRWKLVVATHDRRSLFSQIAGSLSLFGADIVGAEAIGNTSGLVLDVFRVSREGHHFASVPERRRFLKFLEDVVTGARDLDEALDEGPAPALPPDRMRLEWDEASAGGPTLLRVRGRDSRGLLYRLTRGLSDAGCDITLAHIETLGGEVRDEFRLSLDGRAVPANRRREIEAAVQASIGAYGVRSGRRQPPPPAE